MLAEWSMVYSPRWRGLLRGGGVEGMSSSVFVGHVTSKMPGAHARDGQSDPLLGKEM